MNTKWLKFSSLTLPYLLFFLIVLINWFLLSGAADLAPPDFYKYYSYSEKILSADLDIKGSLPLFPLLLGLTGKFLSLFVTASDPYILAGRLLSLFGSLLIVYFVFRILKIIVGEYSIPATLLLLTCPFYLKFMSLPITDILYLSLFVAVFCFLFEKSMNKAFSLSVLALLTRFEAVLLFVPVIYNTVRLKVINLRIRASLTLIFLSLIAVSISFSERLTGKIKFMFTNDLFFYFLLNPDKIASLLYVNIFFFIPVGTPSFIKVILFLIVFGFFIFGYLRLFKLNRMFTLSLLFYQFFFILSKGYIVGVGNIFDPVNQTRRMLSVVFIFWFIAVIGLSCFLKSTWRSIHNRVYLKWSFYFISVIISVFLFDLNTIKKIPLLVILSFVLLSSIIIINSDLIRKSGITVSLILIFFLVSIYSKGLSDSMKYVASTPNKGAYIIAKWADLNMEENGELLCYSEAKTVQYYLEKGIKLINIKFKERAVYQNFEVLRKKLWERAKKNHIRYLAYDYYMNFIDSPFEVAIKRMLEKYRKRDDYFKFKKHLFYKGKVVAIIMEVQ